VRAGTALLALLALCCVFPACSIAASDPAPEQAVEALNAWRALVGVPPVSHDPVQSAGCAAHAEYYRLTHETGHFEDPSKPGYSEAGAKAAVTSVLAYAGGERGPLTWENAVYHRAGLLNPRLATTGFWNEYGLACMGSLTTDASRTTPALTSYQYPYDGQEVVPTTFGCQEIPNPCTVVPGNDGSQPTGFIPSVQFNGPWRFFPDVNVDAAQLVPDGGAPVELTVDRSGLIEAGFAMIPRSPLAEGTWYTASATGSVGEFSELTPAKAPEPFSIRWRFRTEIVPREADLRIGVSHGQTRVISHSPVPVSLAIRDGKTSRQLTLPIHPNPNGMYEATMPTELHAVSWLICASQEVDPATFWLADRTCASGRPLDLQVTVLYADANFLRVRIKAPQPAWGHKANVSLLSKQGKPLDKTRITLAAKSRIDLRAPRSNRAKLRVSVRPFTKRGIPQKVRTIVLPVH
jgi:hypothetical protein